MLGLGFIFLASSSGWMKTTVMVEDFKFVSCYIEIVWDC